MITIRTEKGIGRTESEDTVLAGETIITDRVCCLPVPKQGFVCISDGVGGLDGGADASRFLAGYLLQTAPPPKGRVPLKQLLLDINNRLIQHAADTSAPQMAATLTGVLVSENGNYLFHLGNTRSFLIQGNYLRQLTDDHTLCSYLLRTGQQSAAEQANPNELIGCFGGGDSKYASMLTVSILQDFQTLLMTSDGIHDHLSIDQMEDIMTQNIPDSEKCTLLLQKARQNGSVDDASVMIIRKE